MISDISELTQQDVREKFMCDKGDRDITCVFCGELYLTINVFWLHVYKNVCLKKGEVWQNFFLTQLQSRLSHKVCHLLFSAALLCKFTIIYWISTATSESSVAHKA